MSGNTNEIRTDVNAILDCIDYVCQRLDISQEEVDKVYDFILNEVFTQGIKNGISKALFGEKPKKPRVDYNHKIPHTAKDDWSYELDHLYFDTATNAEKFRCSLMNLLDNYGSVTVADVYDIMTEVNEERAPFDARFYGWKQIDIYGKIKIEPIECGGAQVILPPPVRLRA